MIKKILVLGAGRSVTSLIQSLNQLALTNELEITLADQNKELLLKKTEFLSRVNPLCLNINDKELLTTTICQHDIVISMLPPPVHPKVATLCIQHKKHMITASYVSEEIAQLDQQAKQASVLILMEAGLDPGIDHMSAMKELDEIRAKGGDIISFKSFTGGVVAPESDNNPWNYKITWNPKNIVLSGREGARFIRNSKYKFIPYSTIFSRIDKVIIPDYGEFEAYANRDSLRYKKLYGLAKIPTLLRGTLRKAGFCEAWNVLVKLGLTNNDFLMKDMNGITYREFVNAFLPFSKNLSVEDKIALFAGVTLEHPIIHKINWLGLFGGERINLKEGTPAEILQEILEKKWMLAKGDKDMVVMQHQILYKIEDKLDSKTISMVVKGDNAMLTSMAKTVGFPICKVCELLIQDKLRLRGVHVPTVPEIYEPVLKDIGSIGVLFSAN